MITNLSKMTEVIDIHTIIKRARYERVEIHSTKKFPKIPLSIQEKSLLRQEAQKKCIYKYLQKFKSFINEDETREDLESEAILGFEEMLYKFDKSRINTQSSIAEAFIGTWCHTIDFHVKKSFQKTKLYKNSI